MSSYKLVQFVSKFIKTKQPGFYSHDNFPNQLHCAMMENNKRENENSVESSNRSKKNVIRPYITCTWLNKLGYQYTDIKKGYFLNGYLLLNVIEYRAQFLKELKVLDLYLMGFCNDSSIEKRVYPSDYTVYSLNKRLVILITHDKSIFAGNDSRH